VFSEGKDLPGNILLEQALKAKLQLQTTNTDEFYTEHMDSSHFSDEAHYRIFKDYLSAKYKGAEPNLVIVAMARDYALTEKLPPEVFGAIPTIFMTSSELEVPNSLRRRDVYGVVQRVDVEGTLSLIRQLQPDRRKIVVLGGQSASDVMTLERIKGAANYFPNVQFEYWTNRPIEEIPAQMAGLGSDAVLLISSIFEDVNGRPVYMSRAAQFLAPESKVPIYTFSIGAMGNGIVGGAMINPARMADEVARMALLARDVKPRRPPVLISTNSVAIVDWRALERWKIDTRRVPSSAEVRFRPVSIWEEHRVLISAIALVIVAQALTIAALVAQRAQRRRAETELLQQRTEMAHVTRVSTMGQLASALAHEINQPLGAILRNTEAAEIFLKSDAPDLAELRAILLDIRKDDQRAGEVIDRMRGLLKRRNLELSAVDLNELVAETVDLTRPDAKARQIRMEFTRATGLAPIRADRVHLQQVLINLILNGMDAMKDCANGERFLSVAVRATEADAIEVSVTDAGSGIPEDKLGRVFEPFFTTKPAGMGMGLAISRTIVEAHGRKIRARNNPTKGATLTCILPLARN